MRLCPERHAQQSPWGGNRGPASPISADSAYRNQNVTPSLPWQGSELQACEDHAGCICGGGGTAATPGLGPPTFKKSSIHSAGRPKISSCKEASPTVPFATPCGGQGKRHDPAASERSGKSQRLLPNVPDAGAGTRRLWGNGAVCDSSGKSGEPDRPSCRLPADRCLACGEKRTTIWRQQAFGRPLGFPFAFDEEAFACAWDAWDTKPFWKAPLEEPNLIRIRETFAQSFFCTRYWAWGGGDVQAIGASTTQPRQPTHLARTLSDQADGKPNSKPPPLPEAWVGGGVQQATGSPPARSEPPSISEPAGERQHPRQTLGWSPHAWHPD